MNDSLKEEKTERPTEHRIKKFKKKGKTKYSRELNSLLILSVGLITLWFCRNVIYFTFTKIMFSSFIFNKNIIDNDYGFLKISIFLKEIFFTFFPFLIFLLLIIVAPAIFLSGITLNFKSFQFNFKKINLLYGLKKNFSFQIVVEFFKILLKLFLVISISFFYLYFSFSDILGLIQNNFKPALFYGLNIINICSLLVILGLVPLVFFDVFFQEYKSYKKMKMSYQEVKDEIKEKEGNPSIKNRIRQEMKSAIRRRMMLDVPKSDVIITNPIHYAIALQYNEKKMHAPKVIAKGAGEVAIKIKNLANEHDILIISTPSLARSLYRYAEIGQYIPGPLYKSVAEVLAWVWKVRKWKKEGGVFPEKPKNILVPSDSTFKGKYKYND